MEDDADWDVRIRDQLNDLAKASYALTQPLAGTEGNEYADVTYPKPLEGSPPSVPDFEFDSLPATVEPLISPYGDEWDVLWLGHCGMRFPYQDNKVIPKGRVVQEDHVSPVSLCRTSSLSLLTLHWR